MTRRWTMFALAVGIAGGVAAAQQAQPVFRAGVDLVQVDVVVIDANGQPVHGLSKSDFVVLDKSVPQPIATFSELVHDHPPAKIFPAGLPLDVASNQTAQSDRLVMLVLDDLHFRGRTDEALSIIRKVVNDIEGGASIGVVTTSGTFGIEITEDRELVMRKINDFVDHFDPHVGETPRIPVVNAMGFSMPDPGPNDLPSFFSEFHAFKTVEDVARMMGANDGRRKAMILISAGIENANKTNDAMHPPKDGLDPCFGGPRAATITPQDAVPSSAWAINAMSCNGLNGMYGSLHRSSVTVYPVDPGGPRDRGASLDPVARETGGFAVHANDLEAGLQRLLADLDNYYLLGFYPADPKDKSYHPIEVRVNRPGVTVRHRHGYQPGGPPPPPKNDGPLERLAAPVMPKTDLPLRLGAVPFFGSGSKLQVLATLEVSADAPAPDAGRHAADTVQFAIYAADLTKKKVTASESRRVDVEWPVNFNRAWGAFRVQSVLTLAPGPYQLRASAISKTLDRSGSVYLQIDVPEIKDAPLALSGLALSPSRPDSGLPSVLHVAPVQGVALPFPPALVRVFSPSDTIRVFFQVRRPAADAAVTGVATLVGDDGVERARVPWSPKSASASSIDLPVPLAGVPPGPYRLVVTATNGPRTATREVAIRVE